MGLISVDLIQSKRHWFLQTALHYLGTPYIWGGDDPSGFDCSGFVIECLKSVGLLGEREDKTADQLYRRFCEPGKVPGPAAGRLIFRLDSKGQASHVAICLDEQHMLGASGGGKAQDDIVKSWRDNAFVKIRPVPADQSNYRFVELFEGGE